MEKRVNELERKIGVVIEQLQHCSSSTDNRYGLLNKIEGFEGIIESLNKRISALEADLKVIGKPVEEKVHEAVEKVLEGLPEAVNSAVQEVLAKRKPGRPKKVAIG